MSSAAVVTDALRVNRVHAHVYGKKLGKKNYNYLSLLEILISYKVQCNLSTTATHGTAKKGCCREVTTIERSDIYSSIALWGY